MRGPAFLLLCAVIGPLWIVPAAGQTPRLAQAAEQIEKGNHAEALRLFDAILTDQPGDVQALFYSGRLLAYDGQLVPAEARIETLVKAMPAAFQGWELLIQIAQALGKKERRDVAITQLHAARRSAIDPDIRRRTYFVRDRIAVNGRIFAVQDNFEASGGAFIRFAMTDEAGQGNTDHVIVVGTDDDTNNRWRESGQLALGKVVYYLNTVDMQPDGFHRATPYEFYIDAPDYDLIRARIMEILTGKAQPLSGDADPYWTRRP